MVDYPKADLNFPFRLGQLTATPISRDYRGEPNHVVVTPDRPASVRVSVRDDDRAGRRLVRRRGGGRLREYLDKGGFLWADDFWGEHAWHVWERALRRILPASEFPIFDVPPNHMIRNIDFSINEIPQVPSINHWFERPRHVGTRSTAARRTCAPSRTRAGTSSS